MAAHISSFLRCSLFHVLYRQGFGTIAMAEHHEPTPEEDHPLNPPDPFLDPEKGKKSIIYDYCNDARRSDKKCIWFCRQQGRKTVAWDEEIKDIEDPASSFNLRDFNTWWRRFAFYNYVGVRHVQIRFLRSQKEGNGFLVIARPFEHRDEADRLSQSLGESSFQGHPADCAPDVTGIRHPLNEPDEKCGNWGESDFGEGCIVQGRAMAGRRVETYLWTPAMLDYYWGNGVGSDGLEFLTRAEFVLTYSYLARDTHEDAEIPYADSSYPGTSYGKSINALELVSGWRIKRLLWTTLVAVILDICIVAIVILLTKSGEMALAAGSYAAAIEALMMGLITLLSAVLP